MPPINPVLKLVECLDVTLVKFTPLSMPIDCSCAIKFIEIVVIKIKNIFFMMFLVFV